MKHFVILLLAWSIGAYAKSLSYNRTTLKGRIISGSYAANDEFPFMAFLVGERGHSADGIECGGSIIAKNFILTAAHCLSR